MDEFLLARQVREKLESVRRQLIDAPSQISVESSAETLENVTAGLLALSEALEQSHRGQGPSLSFEAQAELQQLLTLSGRVNALYRQAAGFYGGLAAEAVANGAWDQASYSPSGEWSEVAPSPSRLATEG